MGPSCTAKPNAATPARHARGRGGRRPRRGSSPFEKATGASHRTASARRKRKALAERDVHPPTRPPPPHPRSDTAHAHAHAHAPTPTPRAAPSLASPPRCRGAVPCHHSLAGPPHPPPPPPRRHATNPAEAEAERASHRARRTPTTTTHADAAAAVHSPPPPPPPIPSFHLPGPRPPRGPPPPL
ncbi:hypothetical protein DAI22_10g194250 [Oryza sativa Japonica Group]|nr:hypothetical protein DAI22_10g194250 [Oryza sativa Japonica Group]